MCFRQKMKGHIETTSPSLQFRQYFGREWFISARDAVEFDDNQTPSRCTIVMKSDFSIENRAWLSLKADIICRVATPSLISRKLTPSSMNTTVSTATIRLVATPSLISRKLTPSSMNTTISTATTTVLPTAITPLLGDPSIHPSSMNTTISSATTTVLPTVITPLLGDPSIHIDTTATSSVASLHDASSSLKATVDSVTTKLREFRISRGNDGFSDVLLKKSLCNLGHEVTMLVNGSRSQTVTFQSAKGSAPQTWI
jgi:hypothetical protein